MIDSSDILILFVDGWDGVPAFVGSDLHRSSNVLTGPKEYPLIWSHAVHHTTSSDQRLKASSNT